MAAPEKPLDYPSTSAMESASEPPSESKASNGDSEANITALPRSRGSMADEKMPKAVKEDKSTGKGGKNVSTVQESGEKKLSNKELKLRQKAEKQAKRAAQKTEQEASALPENQPVPQIRPAEAPRQGRRPSETLKSQPGQALKVADMTGHHKRTNSHTGKNLPIRPLPTSHSHVKDVDADTKLPKDNKVAIFSHLYGKDRRSALVGVSREIHPAILTLGIQLRDYVICGGNARCIATLLAFKKVIQSYSTPPNFALARHLTTHLSHQISYLSASRALSTSQGNSIRWLKKLVVELEPTIADQEARVYLCDSIDLFIREKLTVADDEIARQASEKVMDGDVVLVYAKSSIVEKSLLAAHAQGKRFQVVVADSRPLFEGKNMARSLLRSGLDVQYSLLTGLGSLSVKVTKCFLGASAMMGNGRLYSRAGTALVAMTAKDLGGSGPGLGLAGAVGTVPVIVLCESVKFSSKVVLDSVVTNELGDADALVEHEDDGIITHTSTPPTQPSTGSGSGKKGKGGTGGKSEADDDDEATSKKKSGLEGWSEQPNLQLLNLMYDVTPAEYIDMVITEQGIIPPSAVSAVNGIWDGDA